MVGSNIREQRIWVLSIYGAIYPIYDTIDNIKVSFNVSILEPIFQVILTEFNDLYDMQELTVVTSVEGNESAIFIDYKSQRIMLRANDVVFINYGDHRNIDYDHKVLDYLTATPVDIRKLFTC